MRPPPRLLVLTVLAAGVLAPPSRGGDEGDRAFEELSARYEAALVEYTEALVAAEELDRKPKLIHPAATFFRNFEELGLHGSGRALEWCLTYMGFSGRVDAERVRMRQQIYDSVVREHADADFVPTILDLLRHEADPGGLGKAAAAAICREIATAATSDSIRAEALYSEGYLYSFRAISDVDLAMGVASYQELVELYPDSSYAPIARGHVFRFEFLRPGGVPPDFVAHDLKGRELRLSDSRGKITVVAFWGFWNAGTNTLIRALNDVFHVFADEPVAILGINTDEDVDDFMDRCAVNGVTWTNAWQGSRRGPLVEAWGITTFPMTFVLDAEGVVRYVDLTGRALVGAVQRLVDEKAGRTPSVPERSLKPDQELRALENRFLRLQKDFNSDARAFHEAQSRAERDGLPTDGSLSPVLRYAPRFEELAEQGSRGAFGWLVAYLDQFGLPREELANRLVALYARAVEVYPNEVFVEPFAARIASQTDILGLERATALLETLAERSTRERVRAAARYQLAHLLESNSGSLEARELALALFASVVEEQPGSQYAPASAHRSATLERVRIGRNCPQVMAKDLEHATFHSTDYLGKVLVLAFWDAGDAACLATAKADAELVRRHDGEPIAYVALDVSADREALEAIVREHRLDFRNVHLGDRQAPPCKQMGVLTFPTRFVLDHAGRLRYVAVGEEPIEQHVEELLEEARAQR